MKEFDENEAVDFIRNKVGTDSVRAYSDDELLNIIDMIWDFYEMNGLLDIDSDSENDDDDDDVSASDISAYVIRMLKKDKGAAMKVEDVNNIVEAELAYEEWLEEDI
ncbi:MAG: hypothetical protein NC043_03475 [Muribaculaceae bacterium]|nr:hypothetical protein [Muribaculaceae bacterium]